MTSSDWQSFVMLFVAIGIASVAGTILIRYAGQIYWRRRGLVWGGTDRVVLAVSPVVGVVIWAAIALVVVLVTRNPHS